MKNKDPKNLITKPGSTEIRRDIVIENNPKIVAAIKSNRDMIQTSSQLDSTQWSTQRFAIRKTLIEEEDSDPNGFQRIIGTSNLLSVNYLTRGIRAAAAVCRIYVPGGNWCGTGFLVGPRLLMTNNHVLNSKDVAAQCEVSFSYEHDADGVLMSPIQFNLTPHEIFYTDVTTDVTFVAVAPFSDSSVPIERFGYLPLIPLSGKGIQGEFVTIIQHPGGGPKQMALRNSKIIVLENLSSPNLSNRYIHYTTDTEPGSSGAPVLNDQWQVVAIHHKTVANPSKSNTGGNSNSSNNNKWLANQGIWVSAIYERLEFKRFSDSDAAATLARLSRAIGLPPMTVTSSHSPNFAEREGKALPKNHWNDSKFGYDPEFLPVNLKLDKILSQRQNEAAKLKESNDIILNYLHFSSVIDKNRKCPMLTAVNIHGAKLKHPCDTSNSWRRDIRLDDIFQPGDNFYMKKLGNDPVSFDRGHLVRRLNPCWGDTLQEVRLAEKHTFHFTNAAPQVHRYNDIEWGDLEDYILSRTQTLEKKVTVYSGPIFKGQDPQYGSSRKNGPWKIPITFWKIAVIEKSENNISVAAFMIGQIEYLKTLYEARVFKGLKPYTTDELKTRKIQTTVEAVESETGFNFSVLRDYDALNGLESSRQARFIRYNEDIII
ncbi:MAG: DNA/RNA non-specific endonuclease [Calditrichia bacterium]